MNFLVTSSTSMGIVADNSTTWRQGGRVAVSQAISNQSQKMAGSTVAGTGGKLMTAVFNLGFYFNHFSSRKVESQNANISEVSHDFIHLNRPTDMM